jgi:RNA polymerase sigma-70 factor (ECF subfamily)
VERQPESAGSHYPDVFRFVRSRVHSRVDAEDIAQEAFLSAAEALKRSAAGAPPLSLGWLYTVARRRLIDEARRRRVETVPLELARDARAREDEYGGLVADALQAALTRLTRMHRSVVVLRLIEGRSFAEIGAQLGASEEACRVRFMRGLEQLRAEFEKDGLMP